MIAIHSKNSRDTRMKEFRFEPTTPLDFGEYRIIIKKNGEFVRCYGDKKCINGGIGIAIDPSGYCLGVSYCDGTLNVFDQNGTFLPRLKSVI